MPLHNNIICTILNIIWRVYLIFVVILRLKKKGIELVDSEPWPICELRAHLYLISATKQVYNFTLPEKKTHTDGMELHTIFSFMLSLGMKKKIRQRLI